MLVSPTEVTCNRYPHLSGFDLIFNRKTCSEAGTPDLERIRCFTDPLLHLCLSLQADESARGGRKGRSLAQDTRVLRLATLLTCVSDHAAVGEESYRAVTPALEDASHVGAGLVSAHDAAVPLPQRVRDKQVLVAFGVLAEEGDARRLPHHRLLQLLSRGVLHGRGGLQVSDGHL